MGDLCDIGLVLVCLPRESTNANVLITRWHITQLSVIPLSSPVPFVHIGDPYIPPFLIFDLLVSPPF